jgi:putative flippase GtrA
MWRPDKRIVRLFLNYIWIGGLATVVDTAALVVFRVKFGLFVWLSAALAYLCGMVTNFLLNKYVNFSSEDRPILKQARTFFFVATTGLCLKAVLMEIFVQVVHMRLLVAQVFGVGIVMIWSFWGHYTLTFQEGIRSFITSKFGQRSKSEKSPEDDTPTGSTGA